MKRSKTSAQRSSKVNTNGSNSNSITGRCDKVAIIDNFTIAEWPSDGQVAGCLATTDSDDIETAISVDDTTLVLEVVAERLYGKQTTVTTFSCTTDVNEYSNGEKDCDWVSKPTEPRLQPQQILNNRSRHTAATSIKVNVYCNESSAVHPLQQRLAEWPSPNSDEEAFVHADQPEQVNELAIIIDDNDGCALNQNNNCTDLNCNKWSELNGQTIDESNLIDWVVISLELKPIVTICDRTPDDSVQSFEDIVQYSSATTAQYYTAAEYCAVEQQTLVTLHHCSRHSADIDTPAYLMRSQSCYTDSRDLSYSHPKIRRRLWLRRFFSQEIRAGIPTSRSISTNSFASTTLGGSSQSVGSMKLPALLPAVKRRDFMSCESFGQSNETVSTDYPLEQPCSSSRSQRISFYATPIVQSTFTSMSTIDLMRPNNDKCKSNASIADTFGLNDFGDIIIHMDHISEETGFGFVARHKRELYRNVPRGEEVYERRGTCFGHVCKRMMKYCAEKIFACRQGE